MNNNPLVSLITPCHNSEAFIYRLLNSVLSQTYSRVEMITIDNDSHDDTANIIKSYIPQFEAKGYSLIYIHQDDLGPSAGIQTGLKVIQGEYLLMPDSDDFYNTDKAIEIWVNTFESLPNEYAIVRCQLQMIYEKGMKNGHLVYENFPQDDLDTLFEDCLFGRNGYNYAPIGYMVKIKHLRELTGLEIYNAYNVGQQRQICMPLYYKYKAYTIAQPLACYLIRESSVSHGDYAKYETQAKIYKNEEAYIDSILLCCKDMPDCDKQKYRNQYLVMRAQNLLAMAYRYKKDDINIYMNDIRINGGNPDKALSEIKKNYMKDKVVNVIRKCLQIRK